MTNHIRFSLLALLIGLAIGCGKSGTQTVPVRGTITFAGGPPPAVGTITFLPITVKEGLPRRPGSAHFDTSGEFQAMSFQQNDGLIPGTYGVKIECWMGKPDSNDPSSFERLNHVPSNFQPPEIKVDESAGTIEVKIEVPKKK